VEDVQAFVYFTDGYGTVEPEQEPECPVVWCVTQQSYLAERLPFGEVVYVDTANFYR
jgi:predicted metal-dependent peptidase